MAAAYGDRVAFRMVYIEEAHASDVWQLAVNERDEVVYANPKTIGERNDLAQACVRNLNVGFPAVVDGIDNSVEAVYTAWPDRLVVVDAEGKIAHKSGAGPFGFKPAGVKRTLEALLGKRTVSAIQDMSEVTQSTCHRPALARRFLAQFCGSLRYILDRVGVSAFRRGCFRFGEMPTSKCVVAAISRDDREPHKGFCYAFLNPERAIYVGSFFQERLGSVVLMAFLEMNGQGPNGVG